MSDELRPLTEIERANTITIAKMVGFDFETLKVSEEFRELFICSVFHCFDAYTMRGMDFGNAMGQSLEDHFNEAKRRFDR